MHAEEFHSTECFTTLMNAAYHIQHGNTSRAKNHLLELLGTGPRVSQCTSDIQTILFASALMKTCGNGQACAENIYTRTYATRQIDLFDFITKSFPIVTLSKQIANETLAALAAGRERLVLIDVGIGSGGQILELLQLFRTRGCEPETLTIVGIEPDAQSLTRAAASLSAWTAKGRTKFRFLALPHCVEDLTSAQWRELSALEGDVLVNEAYSLHHIKPDLYGNDRKDDVLHRLMDLKPIGFVLTEPHSNHESTSLFTRFRSAWGHYGLAFRVIDKLQIGEDEKQAIKTLFFGREIDDVLANSEADRCERHELADMWINRLTNAGFIPVRVLVPRWSESDIVTVRRKDLYVGLECDGNTLVAIMGVTTPNFQ